MTFVGISGLLISLVAVMFAFPNRSSDRYALALLLLVFHVGASVVYYLYVQSHDADTKFYYFDALGMAHGPGAFGTVFAVQLVQTMRAWLGGSYFDYFLVFQSVGLVGIVILSRSLAEVHAALQLPETRSATWILFLPSLHFWTSAIGKDAPLLFASSLAAWSLLKLTSRWLWFAAAMAVMVLFRPHIALIATVSLTVSLFIDKQQNPLPRILFAAVALISLVYFIQVTNDTLHVDASNPNSVADFIINKQDIFANFEGGTAFHGGFLLRLLSLLFRPFFFDTGGIFGIISSLENLLFFYGFIVLLRNFGQVRRRFGGGLYAKYCYVFTFVLTISLALLYYNVGLGLRQRVMVYPTLLPLFVAAWAITGARIRAGVPPFAFNRRAPSPAPLPEHAATTSEPPQPDPGLHLGKAGD